MKKRFVFLIILIGVIIDQLLKIMVTNRILLNDSIKCIGNIVKLTFVVNYGGAYSIRTK